MPRWLQDMVEWVFFQVDNANYWRPSLFGLATEDSLVKAKNGLKLYTLFMPAFIDGKYSVEKAKGTIFYVHPCRQNLHAHFTQIAWLVANGYNVFSYDPTGCGRSEGDSINLSSINDDIETAYQALLERNDIDPNRIIGFGQDAGAYALLHLADGRPEGLRAIILDSIWATQKGLFLKRYGPGLGHLFHALMAKHPDPIESLRRLTLPSAFMVCDINELVPKKETVEVLKAAPSDAEIWREAKSQHMRTFAEPTICQHYFLTFVEKVLAK